MIVAFATPGMLNGAISADLPMVSMFDWISLKRILITFSCCSSMMNGSIPAATASLVRSRMWYISDCLLRFISACVMLHRTMKFPHACRSGSACLLHQWPLSP